MRYRYYPGIDHTSIELLAGEDLPVCESRYARISVPAGQEHAGELLRGRGYAMADRTLEVKVPLQHGAVDFDALCKLPVVRSDGYREAVREIAKASFTNDFRFRVSFSPEHGALASAILDEWVDEQGEVFVCLYKDMPVGFADVRRTEREDGAPFIYLAAVDARYRMTGAALSLYANVMRYYRDEGVRAVYGRISTANTAVMNLYIRLGAQASDPFDIYIKL